MFTLSLEEISDRNLVRYFGEELVKEGLGDISVVLRRKMRKLGILTLKRTDKFGSKMVLSDYGRRLLEEAKKNE